MLPRVSSVVYNLKFCPSPIIVKIRRNIYLAFIKLKRINLCIKIFFFSCTNTLIKEIVKIWDCSVFYIIVPFDIRSTVGGGSVLDAFSDPKHLLRMNLCKFDVVLNEISLCTARRRRKKNNKGINLEMCFAKHYCRRAINQTWALVHALHVKSAKRFASEKLSLSVEFLSRRFY